MICLKNKFLYKIKLLHYDKIDGSKGIDIDIPRKMLLLEPPVCC